VSKSAKDFVLCGNCKKCTLVTDREKCSVDGKPILGRCVHWTESKSCLLSWPHVCVYYDAK
jgi:hypothetical protein